MLRLKLVDSKLNSLCIFRTYLSEEFKYTMVKLPILHGEKQALQTKQGVILPRAVSSGNKQKLCDKLLKMRLAPEEATASEAANWAIIRHYMDTGHVDDLLTMIEDPFDCGLYIDNFPACYLMDYFLNSKNYTGACQVGLQIFSQDNPHSSLTTALALKSFFEYLKRNVNVGANDNQNKSSEMKVRVKFLRNINHQDIEYRIGKALFEICESSPSDIKLNTKSLALLLHNQPEEFFKIFEIQKSAIYGDILNLCRQVLENKKYIEEKQIEAIKQQLEQNSNLETFEDKLNVILKDALDKEQSLFIKDQNEKYYVWQNYQLTEEKQSKDLKQEMMNQWKSKMSTALTNIEAKKQKLWYFELKDKIDLEVFNKVKTYPKRWFGKKKKPKVSDDSYIPPDAIKRA